MAFPVGDFPPTPDDIETPGELPLVYVVTALTALSDEERKLVDGWCDTITGG